MAASDHPGSLNATDPCGSTTIMTLWVELLFRLGAERNIGNCYSSLVARPLLVKRLASALGRDEWLFHCGARVRDHAAPLVASLLELEPEKLIRHAAYRNQNVPDNVAVQAHHPRKINFA